MAYNSHFHNHFPRYTNRYYKCVHKVQENYFRYNVTEVSKKEYWDWKNKNM